jgi:kynurenine formamidase
LVCCSENQDAEQAEGEDDAQACEGQEGSAVLRRTGLSREQHC